MRSRSLSSQASPRAWEPKRMMRRGWAASTRRRTASQSFSGVTAQIGSVAAAIMGSPKGEGRMTNDELRNSTPRPGPLLDRGGEGERLQLLNALSGWSWRGSSAANSIAQACGAQVASGAQAELKKPARTAPSLFTPDLLRSAVSSRLLLRDAVKVLASAQEQVLAGGGGWAAVAAWSWVWSAPPSFFFWGFFEPRRSPHSCLRDKPSRLRRAARHR